MRRTVRIREVGPREALQADPTIVPTQVKLNLLQTLVASGVPAINAVSLVHPKLMPQMADAEDLLRLWGPQEIPVSALTPNRKAVERAIGLAEDGLVQEVLLVHAATAAVLKANGIDLPLDDHLDEVRSLAAAAQAGGLSATVFISAAFGCSVEGRVPRQRVLELVARMVDLPEFDEIAVSDSTGQADPVQVEQLLAELAPIVGDHPVTLHLHDSRGSGSANAYVAVRSEIPNLTLDASFGGLGGDIPFLPEAAGNVATEDICEMLHGMGVRTGVDVTRVAEASRLLHEETGCLIQSRVYVNGPVAWKQEQVV